MRLMAKHTAVLQYLMELGYVLFTGRILPRGRELAELRISKLAAAPSCGGEHVEIARRRNLFDEKIEWVTHGLSAPD